MQNNKLRTFILAAGEGTRLRPYTIDRPKCMVEIDGVSLLDRQLAVLAAESITDIFLIGGYLHEMLERPDVQLRNNPRYAETNMVWTLFAAEADFRGDMIVSYGDIVYSRSTLRALIKSKADIAVAVDLDWESYWRQRNENPLDDAETLKLRPDGRIMEIGQKPNSLSDIDGQYMGLMKFSTKGMNLLKKTFFDAKIIGSLGKKQIEHAYMTDLLQDMINLDYRVEAVTVNGGWVEVDTVGDLQSDITKKRLIQIGSSI